jgi:hypothetical protein
MVHMITRSYDNFEDARGVVVRLQQVGVQGSAIGLIGRQETGDDGTAEGASIGGVAGGVAGLLADLGVIAIPGIGPVVAGGWLASMMAGTAGGALAGGALGGALLEAGITDRDANYYAETVRRGASLVSVRTEGTLATTVEAIMEAARPIDHRSSRTDYEREGWTVFDERAGLYRQPSWSDLT